MNPKSLEQIESKLAFLEKANTDLSDVVFRQQRDIEMLQAQIKRLESELSARPVAERQLTLEEERPPHY